ncbi:hypothetical protein K2X33_06875 [bacterium]|nr:hypothetical protein [bacterium]
MFVLNERVKNLGLSMLIVCSGCLAKPYGVSTALKDNFPSKFWTSLDVVIEDAVQPLLGDGEYAPEESKMVLQHL